MNKRSVIRVLLHVGFAYFLGWLSKKLFSLEIYEILVTYFIVLAMRYLSMIDNFMESYIANPEYVETSLRTVRKNILGELDQ